MQRDYPVIEDLPTTQVHPEINHFAPRHRLRKEQNGYPLLQVGPGIVTLNEAKNYSWANFRAGILRLIDAVMELYPTPSFPLNFIKCEMRFLNGIRFDLMKEHPLTFLKEKLHLGIEPAPEFFASGGFEEKPHSVNLDLAYPCKHPMGHLALSAHLGQMDGKSAYLLQSMIQSNGEMVPADKDAFEGWLKESHETLEHCFQCFCQGALMEKFCGTRDER